MKRPGFSLVRPVAKIARVARSDGAAVVAARALRKAAERLSAGSGQQFPVFLDDIVADPKDVAPAANWRSRRVGDPLVINWVTTPPGPGSGGHTTMLRMVEYLESRGHECRIYLYDRYLGDARAHESVIREHWPKLRSRVFDVRAGLAPADAAFATGWPTAHILARSSVPGKRFYLVQDFEPYFHPLGSEYVLAELTYRFGFHGITAGRWLADRLQADYGMTCDWFDFGCDSDIYRVRNQAQRNGVVFYAKPDVGRRAYVLGILGLQAFARRHPEVEIHCYGNRSSSLPFPAVDHGRLTPVQLNDVYNRCAAGLSLSLTNVSLVPWEMMASGCVPVVNDAEQNRVVLGEGGVRYAALEPDALADALSEAVTAAEHGRRALQLSTAVSRASWEEAGRLVESVLDREIHAG